ncbi:MAG: glycosyltransferase family 2 protein [Erysipelotrichaceae bacterium]|nr:glycosyltransferase family 2 protein [Erysipelotrichaceae bacterium]
MKKISLVVPMYNEEEMIPLFFEKMNEVLSQIKNYKFEYVLVNDGSRDDTLKMLKEQKKVQNNIKIVSFSRNFGHEAAVCAGFQNADGDAVIVMDADLQDPPEIISKMIEKYEEGYKVVNGKRVDRKKDSFLKRTTASMFYKVIKKLSGKIKVPENVGNYRLLDKEVVDHLNALPEKNRVFRVQVPYIGFKTCEVEFVRPERPKGETHYNYKSMFRLAMDSITSSSVAPLIWPMLFGLIGCGIFGMLFVVDLVLYIIQLVDITFIPRFNGLGFLILISIFLGVSIILVFMGIIGIYISKITTESQDRPVYIIDELID